NTTSSGYDADSNLTTVTRPNGTTATRTFDANDGLTDISDQGTNGFSFVAHYTRTPEELLASRREVDNPLAPPLTYSYDGAQRLTGTTLAGASTKTYGYDNADNPTGFYGTNGLVTQVFDAANELTAFKNPTTN